MQLITAADDFDEFIVTEVKTAHSVFQKSLLSCGNSFNNNLLLGCNKSLLLFMA